MEVQPQEQEQAGVAGEGAAGPAGQAAGAEGGAGSGGRVRVTALQRELMERGLRAWCGGRAGCWAGGVLLGGLGPVPASGPCVVWSSRQCGRPLVRPTPRRRYNASFELRRELTALETAQTREARKARRAEKNGAGRPVAEHAALMAAALRGRLAGKGLLLPGPDRQAGWEADLAQQGQAAAMSAAAGSAHGPEQPPEALLAAAVEEGARAEAALSGRAAQQLEGLMAVRHWAGGLQRTVQGCQGCAAL